MAKDGPTYDCSTFEDGETRSVSDRYLLSLKHLNDKHLFALFFKYISFIVVDLANIRWTSHSALTADTLGDHLEKFKIQDLRTELIK